MKIDSLIPPTAVSLGPPIFPGLRESYPPFSECHLLIRLLVCDNTSTAISKCIWYRTENELLIVIALTFNMMLDFEKSCKFWLKYFIKWM